MEGIEYNEILPEASLADYVDSFWMLSNHNPEEKQIVIVPDGRIDVCFSSESPDELILLGLESESSQEILTPGKSMFVVSFKLPGIEYLFDRKFPALVDAVYTLPGDYFGFTGTDFNTLDQFYELLSKRLSEKLVMQTDPRKLKLFELIYTSAGTVSVHEISERLHWSSRQINRYFNERFGISLKSYCNILRFRASFGQLKAGKLFPEQNFSDQAHFIKNVKKFAGVTPKELFKNKNDRFIQFSTLPKK